MKSIGRNVIKLQIQSNARKEEKRNNRRQAQAIHSDDARHSFDTPKVKHNLEIDIDKLVLENKHFKMVSAGGGGGWIIRKDS